MFCGLWSSEEAIMLLREFAIICSRWTNIYVANSHDAATHGRSQKRVLNKRVQDSFRGFWEVAGQFRMCALAPKQPFFQISEQLIRIRHKTMFQLSSTSIVKLTAILKYDLFTLHNRFWQSAVHCAEKPEPLRTIWRANSQNRRMKSRKSLLRPLLRARQKNRCYVSANNCVSDVATQESAQEGLFWCEATRQANAKLP